MHNILLYDHPSSMGVGSLGAAGGTPRNEGIIRRRVNARAGPRVLAMPWGVNARVGWRVLAMPRGVNARVGWRVRAIS